MEHNLCILLYSKYSEICVDLLKAIEICPIDICKENSITLLCVDNKDIRKKIIECKNIKIKTLPTLLFIYDDDVVIKHEEQKVFDWIDNYVNKQLASKKEETLQIQIEDLKNNISDIQYMYETQIKELLYKLEMNKLEINKLEMNILEMNKLEINKLEINKLEMNKLEMNKLEMNKLEMNKKNNYDNYDNKNNSTTIEELEKNTRPLAGFRNGPNNYEMSDFGNQKQPERNPNKNYEIIDNKASLMQTALSMQKEREVIDNRK